VDARLRLPLGSRLMLSQLTAPLWIVTQIGHASRQKAPYEDLGVTLIEVTAGTNGGVDIAETAKALAERGLTRILVEGGGQLAASMLKADLIDRIAWFRAPSIVGGDGLPAIAGIGAQQVSDLIGFERLASGTWGADSLEILARRR